MSSTNPPFNSNTSSFPSTCHPNLWNTCWNNAICNTIVFKSICLALNHAPILPTCLISTICVVSIVKSYTPMKWQYSQKLLLIASILKNSSKLNAVAFLFLKFIFRFRAAGAKIYYKSTTLKINLQEKQRECRVSLAMNKVQCPSVDTSSETYTNTDLSTPVSWSSAFSTKQSVSQCLGFAKR